MYDSVIVQLSFASTFQSSAIKSSAVGFHHVTEESLLNNFLLSIIVVHRNFIHFTLFTHAFSPFCMDICAIHSILYTCFVGTSRSCILPSCPYIHTSRNNLCVWGIKQFHPFCPPSGMASGKSNMVICPGSSSSFTGPPESAVEMPLICDQHSGPYPPSHAFRIR